jgi:HAE1 family hydrophobic/amphiphilic exporter-1
MTGVMFKQLGWIVTITVVTSTIAAITLTPMLASRMMRLRPKKANPGRYSYENLIERHLDKLDLFYENTIRWVLRNKKIVAGFAFLFFLGSFGLMKFVGTDFMPESDESRVTAMVELQSGIRVEETTKIARRLEKIVQENYPEVTVLAASSGSDDEGSLTSLFNSSGSNIVNLQMRLKPIKDRNRSVWDIAEDLRNRLDNMAEVSNYTVSTTGGGFGGSSNTVDVEIYGFDFDKTNRLAQEMKKRFTNINGARDIQISRKDDKPEMQIILDKAKLAQHNLSSASVSSAINHRISGLKASMFREEGEEYDIIVRFQEEYRNSITDIEGISLLTPMGKLIKLSEIAQVKEYWGPPNIERKRKERIVKVSVKPVGVSLGEMAESIKSELAQMEIPSELLVNVGGAYEDQMESFADLGMLLLLSLVLVFLVMASQFESFVMPFVIMFSIPFAFTGVILSLLITGTSLSVIAALGAVLLVGIVVKNGIVLVDYINLMRDRGYELNEAIALSGRSRLRPVLMTALTTILGMLPMAISTGAGSELWRPMGITVIGGLTVSTLVTMVIIPVMYSVLAKHGERDKKQKVRKQFQFMHE